MEPTSNSKPRAPAEPSDGRDRPADDAEYVCKVCRRSIPPTADAHRRERLVHEACLAELRCGVTVVDVAGRRTRERDNF